MVLVHLCADACVPFVEHPLTDGSRARQVQRVAVGGKQYAVRRVFSRASWERNGRFYGGWWQMMSKEIRQQIHINDQPTVEIDFKGLHVTILSFERGVQLTGDPYTLAEPPFPAAVEDQRGAMKKLVLTAINAKSASAAFSAFRDGFGKGAPEATLTNIELQAAVDKFTEMHPQLTDCMFADEGIRLMWRDSEVARAVIDMMTAAGIPVLCIHDSFIVDQQHQDFLQAQMDAATSRILGTPFKTTVTHGRRCHDPVYDGKHVHPAQLVKTASYEARLAAWRAANERKHDPDYLDYG